MIEDNTDLATLMKRISAKSPDLVEFRLDELHDRNRLEEITSKKSFPTIATDRSDRDQRKKLEQLTYAASLGFDLIDLELATTDAATVKHMKSEGAQIILSFHDFSQTPSKEHLTKILRAEKKLGGDVCKIVTTARQPHDNLTILDFVESEAPKVRLISFAMGSQGVPSRVLSPLFGAEFTFASLGENLRTAEGQLSIDQLRSAWQILEIQ